MAIEKKEIQEPVRLLRRAATDLAKFLASNELKKNQELTGKTEKDFLKQFDGFYNMVMELAEKLKKEGQVSEFGKFFTAVGDSMVRAQRQMDKKSALYIEETRKDPHILPSIFRIPKISADIKFALQSIEGSKINLLFYSKHKQSQEKHEQSLKFDIISAPPPQEVMDKIINARSETGSLPHINFLTNPDERKSIFNTIKTLAKGAPKIVLKKDFNRVLILEWPTHKKKYPEYFLILANPDETGQGFSKNMGIWYLKLGEEAALELAYSYSRQPHESEKTGAGEMYSALLEACNNQMIFLDKLE
ncbi:MAG: hypothetical protein GY860_17940 [Desulfobacteraceae bacterium]|nr:hypothetical protein [Desulfobacteraceae bacterium]